MSGYVKCCVQACHDLVPSDWLQPVIRHLCNQFVHDRARPEEITVGLKTVREICMRMPLIMTEEVLLVRLTLATISLSTNQFIKQPNNQGLESKLVYIPCATTPVANDR